MAGANFGDPGRDVVVADGALDLGCDLAGGEQVAEERRTTPVAARVVHNTMAQRALGGADERAGARRDVIAELLTMAWVGEGTDVGLSDALTIWFGP